MSLGLTLKQAELLAFLTERQAAGGAMPSYEEMAAAIGNRAKSGVARLIDSLIERGHVRRIAGYARSIEVIEHGLPVDGKAEDLLRAYCHVTGMTRAAVIAAALREYFANHPLTPAGGGPR